jgi:hypothetical protein
MKRAEFLAQWKLSCDELAAALLDRELRVLYALRMLIGSQPCWRCGEPVRLHGVAGQGVAPFLDASWMKDGAMRLPSRDGLVIASLILEADVVALWPSDCSLNPWTMTERAIGADPALASLGPSLMQWRSTKESGGESYWANVCAGCRAIQGDFHIDWRASTRLVYQFAQSPPFLFRGGVRLLDAADALPAA